jgi:hypothetical protein
MEVPAVNCRRVARLGTSDKSRTRLSRGTHKDFWEREVRLLRESQASPVKLLAKRAARMVAGGSTNVSGKLDLYTGPSGTERL